MRHGIGFLVLLCLPATARAGMPGMRKLSEVARMRLENVSFFLLVLLLSAAAVMGIWNTVRKDVPRLPRLTYGKALGLVLLWGLLFGVVLGMINGARELLTPGAWKRAGATYELVDAPRPGTKPSTREGRP